MRNALAHPHEKNRRLLTGIDIRAQIELQELALAYVELALLRAIDFDGIRSNRLTATHHGEVEEVPWV